MNYYLYGFFKPFKLTILRPEKCRKAPAHFIFIKKKDTFEMITN